MCSLTWLPGCHCLQGTRMRSPSLGGFRSHWTWERLRVHRARVGLSGGDPGTRMRLPFGAPYVRPLVGQLSQTEGVVYNLFSIYRLVSIRSTTLFCLPLSSPNHLLNVYNQQIRRQVDGRGRRSCPEQ